MTNFTNTNEQEKLSSYAKRKALDFFFEYETPKVVKVYSTRLGAINRTVQFLVIGYVIGYIFIYAKGYQAFEKAESTTIAKVKGMIKTNFSASTGANNVWDATDLENDAVFITTNFIQTPSQQSGKCPEDTNNKFARCRTDSGCTAGEQVLLGNGFKTGQCVQATGTCEIDGWCPAEVDDKPEPPIFMEAENFTIMVKNYVTFPEFDVKRRNIPDDMKGAYINTCRYHPVSDPYCPIFTVQRLVELAHENFSVVARTGAIFGFIIEWDCNLDFSVEYCLPKYQIRRIDSVEEKIAKGWNFRHADYWNAPDGTRRRTLYKFYGIKFVFMVYGKAGRFSPEELAMNLGSGIGLLGIATILCDFLTDFLLRTDAFGKSKFERIRDTKKKGPPTLKTMLENAKPPGAVMVIENEPDADPDASTLDDDSSSSDEDGSTRRGLPEQTPSGDSGFGVARPEKHFLLDDPVKPVHFQRTRVTSL
ncbi:P2X purinoceptor 4 [Hypsibius exemplaris]|uniref:P2X purinoceptor 4 n=1 Tax=Hypsibius exemplaris TaxID=2072580 RepID=A0A1W0XB51_HYPEX|nr:P2X purinoceptor 4 [Hypsibius exemplaris]